MKIHRRTFVARKCLEKSSRNAARIFFPEIGGRKNRGPAPSGICNWRMANWFGVTNRREHGRSMEITISSHPERSEAESKDLEKLPLGFRHGIESLVSPRKFSGLRCSLDVARNDMSYIELHACSAFSFLRGGSFPEQLAEVAAELEMPAIALLDRNGVYGAQRFSVAAREHGIRPINGAELSMEVDSILPVLVENRTGYKTLCELLTQSHLRSEKGKCAVHLDELLEFAQGLVALFGLGSAGASPAVSRASRDTSSGLFGGCAEKWRRGVRAPPTIGDRAGCLFDIFRRGNVFVELHRHFIRGE